MSQKIIKIGSSLGVTLSRHVLQDAGLKHGDEVKLAFNTTSGLIEVSSSNLELHYQELREAKSLVNKHREELQKLDD